MCHILAFLRANALSQKRHMPAQWQSKHSHVLVAGLSSSLTTNVQYYFSFLEYNQTISIKEGTATVFSQPTHHLAWKCSFTYGAKLADVFSRWYWKVRYHPPYSLESKSLGFWFQSRDKGTAPWYSLSSCSRFSAGCRLLHLKDQQNRASNGILQLPDHLQRVVSNASYYFEGL